MKRTAHDRQMDALARLVGDVLHGETVEDSVYVCAAVIAFALTQMPKAYRDDLRQRIAAFIDETIEEATRCDSELN